VEITDADGDLVARGLVNFSSEELPQMLGRSTSELGENLGDQYERSVVHVDDLVVVRL
ncbi:MAG: glutamate 5-kinase, partial [Micrococcaceae bacterium]|nr:glutamate 5-kinase [Micrococcaceae bacterium]